MRFLRAPLPIRASFPLTPCPTPTASYSHPTLNLVHLPPFLFDRLAHRLEPRREPRPRRRGVRDGDVARVGEDGQAAERAAGEALPGARGVSDECTRRIEGERRRTDLALVRERVEQLAAADLLVGVRCARAAGRLEYLDDFVVV